jgi:hypothetical protein
MDTRATQLARQNGQVAIAGVNFSIFSIRQAYNPKVSKS